MFDHTLFCQTDDEVLAKTFPFEQSAAPLSKHVDVARAAGLVDAKGPAFRNVVVHEQPNIDFWYAPPACAGLHVLAFEGELFSFRLSATAAYYMQFGFSQARKWHDAARNKLDAVHVALRDGCGALVQQMREPWHLVALDRKIDASSLSNGAVWGPTARGWGPLDVGAERALRLSIPSDGEGIEPQQIELAFGRVPSPEMIAQIQRALNQLLAAALSA